MRVAAPWRGPGARGAPWPALVALAVAAAAALWWTLVWFALEPSVLGRVPLLDEQYYLRRAAQIADQGPSATAAFVMSPLYPYLVAAVGSGEAPDAVGVLGKPPLGIRMLQILAWAATACLLWATARQILAGWRLSPRASGTWALLPALFFVLYRPASIYALTVLLEIPLTFLVTAVLFLFSRWVGPGGSDQEPTRPIGRAAALLGGLLIGLAALLRPHALLLLIPAWLVLCLSASAVNPGSRRLRCRQGMTRALMLTATALLVIAPAVVHNSRQADRLAGISLNAGLNLYLGQRPSAGGLFVTLAGLDAENDPAGLAYLSRELGEPVGSPAAAETIWTRLAWRAIAENPLRAVGLWMNKVWLHFQAWEIPQVTPLAAWPRACAPLRALFMPYGLITALGLSGLILLGWREARLRPWLLAVALLIAGQSLFFVVSRYRLVIVPALCLGAGLGLAALAAPGPSRIAPRIYAIVFALALLTVWPWSLADEGALWQQYERENEAARWGRWALRGEATAAERQDALQRAETLYRESIGADATRWRPYRDLSRVLAADDRVEAAVRVLDDGNLYALQPDPLRREAILLLLQSGRPGEALDRIPSYLRDFPDDPDILHNYAVLLGQTGRLTLALEIAGRLRDRVPADPRGYIDLGILLARSGDPAAARDVFSAGLLRFPDNAELIHNLDRLPSP